MDRTLVRYLLFQLPEWCLVALLLLGLHRFADAPMWLLWAAGLGFVAKDVALYPWMRPAYERVANDPGERLVGRRAVATSEIAAEGWVRIDAELWRAETEGAPIAAGTEVWVRALDGHVLVVEPDPAPPTPS